MLGYMDGISYVCYVINELVMKMLIERMKSDHRETIYESAKNYPNTFLSVMNELRTKGFWPELTYETVSTLVTHLGLKGYDPCYIAEVFEN